MGFFKVAWRVLFVMGASGCSAEAARVTETDFSSPEGVGLLSEELGQSCATAEPTARIPGTDWFWLTLDAYDDPGCYKSKVFEWSATPSMPPASPTEAIAAGMDSALPTERTACEDLVIKGYRFARDSAGNWVTVDHQSAFGTWNDHLGACTNPNIRFLSPRYTSKFAISARARWTTDSPTRSMAINYVR